MKRPVEEQIADQAKILFKRLMDATVFPGYSRNEAILLIREELKRTRSDTLDLVRDAVGFAADVPEAAILDSLRNLVARIRSFEAAQSASLSAREPRQEKP